MKNNAAKAMGAHYGALECTTPEGESISVWMRIRILLRSMIVRAQGSANDVACGAYRRGCGQNRDGGW